ncbi:hypothetical protein CsSME_00048873 [Camellia sinensis var. sinensis]
MAVLVLCNSSIYCSNVNYTALTGNNRQYHSKCNGSMVNWKKHRRKMVGLCGFVMKSSHGLMAVSGKPNGGMSSEEAIGVLKSISSDPEEAFSFFKSVAQLRNVVHTAETCNYMLELLMVHKRVGDMAVVFDLMQKQIIYRNLNTYLIIFKALRVKGGIRQAPFALERMRKEGFVLNGYSYNGLIHLLLQSGCCKQASEVYRRVVSEGIKPSLKTYSALMVASGKRRDIETVMGLLEEMESLGLRPNVYTFTICIRVLGRAGKIDEAYGLLKRMDDEGCGPDVITYTVLIDALCHVGKLDKAKEVFLKMKSSSHKPD